MFIYINNSKSPALQYAGSFIVNSLLQLLRQGNEGYFSLVAAYSINLWLNSLLRQSQYLWRSQICSVIYPVQSSQCSSMIRTLAILGRTLNARPKESVWRPCGNEVQKPVSTAMACTVFLQSSFDVWQARRLRETRGQKLPRHRFVVSSICRPLLTTYHRLWCRATTAIGGRINQLLSLPVMKVCIIPLLIASLTLHPRQKFG